MCYLFVCCVAGEGAATPNAPKCTAGDCRVVGGCTSVKSSQYLLKQEAGLAVKSLPTQGILQKGPPQLNLGRVAQSWERKGVGQRCLWGHQPDGGARGPLGHKPQSLSIKTQHWPSPHPPQHEGQTLSHGG